MNFQPIEVPIKLLRKFRKCKGKFHILADTLDINVSYVYNFMRYGKEPTDKTEKGQEARLKLGLSRIKKKVKVISDKPKYEKPDFIKEWGHLPTDERHRTIKEYLKWRNEKNNDT